jgi:hypothetical protein
MLRALCSYFIRAAPKPVPCLIDDCERAPLRVASATPNVLVFAEAYNAIGSFLVSRLRCDGILSFSSLIDHPKIAFPHIS